MHNNRLDCGDESFKFIKKNAYMETRKSLAKKEKSLETGGLNIGNSVEIS